MMSDMANNAIWFGIDCLIAPLDWFNSLLESAGIEVFVVGMFMIYAVFRVLIAPLMGAAINTAASDTVRSVRRSYLRNRRNKEKQSTAIAKR